MWMGGEGGGAGGKNLNLAQGKKNTSLEED